MLNAKTDSIMQILYQIALGLRIMEDLEAILGASTIAIFLLAAHNIESEDPLCKCFKDKRRNRHLPIEGLRTETLPRNNRQAEADDRRVRMHRHFRSSVRISKPDLHPRCTAKEGLANFSGGVPALGLSHLMRRRMFGLPPRFIENVRLMTRLDSLSGSCCNRIVEGVRNRRQL